jgi:hypothetical protein
VPKNKPPKKFVKYYFEAALDKGLQKQYSEEESRYLENAAILLDLFNEQEGFTASLIRADFDYKGNIDKTTLPFHLRISFRYESERKTENFINEPIIYETNIDIAMGHQNGKYYATHCYWSSDKEIDKKARFFFNDLSSFEALLSSVRSTLYKNVEVGQISIKRAIFEKLSERTKEKIRPDLKESRRASPLKSSFRLK